MAKIENARVIVTSPGRNFVTLKIETTDGVYGIGDGTLNGRELAVAAYLRDHVVPMLIGRDPADIEDTWQLLYKGAYWRRGPVTMASIAAVDMALWDIKGKVLGAPVWDLLGGRSRAATLVYTHASARTIEETVEQVAQLQGRGFKAVRAQCLVPGIDEMYGVPRQGGTEDSSLPFVETGWDTSRYMRFVPKLFEAVRTAVGEELHLLHDAHHRLSPIEAGRLGRDLEEFRLFWLEDAVPAELQAAFRVVRQHTTTPLAVGEVFNNIHDCEQLVREQLIDYLRMSAVHGGGITHLRKVAAFAEVYHVKLGCHGAADLSPVTMAAAAHLGLATNNVAIQEYAEHPEQSYEVFPHHWSVVDGYLHPGDAPGLGVDIDERAAERFGYVRSYLPVSRKTDGAISSW
ncbi:MAG TPA: D-mannonate dehydratase ManD [Acidimicrobiales bacterium]|nr:D-mannonate dehydratase ManD [Acidimicrobiales bacterium]